VASAAICHLRECELRISITGAHRGGSDRWSFRPGRVGVGPAIDVLDEDRAEPASEVMMRLPGKIREFTAGHRNGPFHDPGEGRLRRLGGTQHASKEV